MPCRRDGGMPSAPIRAGRRDFVFDKMKHKRLMLCKQLHKRHVGTASLQVQADRKKETRL